MKVAIYCRLSDEDDDKLSETDDSLSIQNQKAMLIKYASDNGWHIYDIYSDDDYTGADRNRPEFNRLIRDARSKKFDIVLCKTQSRFTRELELVEKYIHGLFPRLGIRFISIVDNGDTDNKGNKKTRQINGLVNEWFLEELSDSIKSVLTSRRKNGLHIGSFAPYGYLKDPFVKGHLIIDPEAAEVVRKIFKLYAEGHGKQVIARMLNDWGVPNPTEYKRLHGMVRNKNAKSGTLWHYFSIDNILTNEVYIGNMVQGKSGVASYKTREKVSYPQDQWIRVKGTHEPIIDQELWNKVQNLMSEKAASYESGPHKHPISIFTGKVRCFHCGGRMRSVKNGEKRGFKCEKHALSFDACIGSYISTRKLERIVVAELHALSDELLNEEELEEGIDLHTDLKDMRKQIEAETEIYKRKLNEYTTGMKNLYLDKVKGIISEDAFMQMSQEFRDQKDRMVEQIAECIEQINQIDKTLAIKVNRKLMVQQYVGTQHLTREMTEILINYILVGKQDPETKYTPVVIHWNF